MKVLFLGGTGRLSKDVAKLSNQKGYQTYLLTRGTSSRSKFVENGYHMLVADLKNRERVISLIQGLEFDVVVDFLSYTVEDLKYSLDLFENRFRQYIFISSATVFGPTNQLPISEDSLVENKESAYATNKINCEKYISCWFRNRKDCFYTIVRPYITYGDLRVPYPIVPLDNGKEWSLIYRIERELPIPIFNQGQTVTTLTHTKDFAKAVVGLFLNQLAENEDFNVTSSNEVTWGNVLKEISLKLGKPLRVQDFSQKKIYGSMCEYKDILVGDKGRNMSFDNSKIKAVVPEFTNFVGISEGIKNVLEFYNDNPEYRVVDYRWNGKIDRLCHIIDKEACLNLPPYKRQEYLAGRYFIYRVMSRILRRKGQ